MNSVYLTNFLAVFDKLSDDLEFAKVFPFPVFYIKIIKRNNQIIEFLITAF
jgi:hypothetical protein